MPNATPPLPRPRAPWAAAPTHLRAWAAVAALGAALSAGARAEAPPPAPPPGATAVALLYTPGVPAARRPHPAPAPGPHTPHGATSHDGSHIPTPIDNPWALGLLAALAARMLWLDWRSKQDSN
ncbi:hypothetical protein [Acidovorax sp. FJL06]|uniref:hypothetical protein n=1 Tax=Acidovorax sp. FJL06 TaxID=2153365 RepID=UPI000F56BD93|nr:hypothetical protein [Acidovorax sp. FJL06]RQO82600.1 hypothetical protein DBV10_07505 [Acidovorax sp. FJL06]